MQFPHRSRNHRCGVCRSSDPGEEYGATSRPLYYFCWPHEGVHKGVTHHEQWACGWSCRSLVARIGSIRSSGFFMMGWWPACLMMETLQTHFRWPMEWNRAASLPHAAQFDALGQGWATPGTWALLSGTWVGPRKRDPPPSNEKVNNVQVAVLSDETRCPFLHFRLLTIHYLI